jgi:hypothetical protein
MNYSTLFTTIKGYLESDFPDTVFYGSDGTTVDTFTSVEQINTFITQAEQRIYNSIQFPSLRKNVTGATTASNKYLACPTDFLSPFSMAVVTGVTNANLDTGTYSYLLNKDVNFIRESYPSPNDTGVPAHYALFGPATTNATPPAVTTELSFMLGPTPDAVYFMELHYYYLPESITTISGGQTWLGDNIDSVLLYGAMVEACTFQKAEADVYAAYNGKYQEALALAKRLGDGLERQDAYRSGQARVPVK